MKKNILILLLSLFFCACNQTDERKHPTEKKSETVTPSAQTNVVTKREKLIGEIKTLMQAMAEKDKPAILAYFNFPLADSSVNFFEVDPIFDAARKANNDRITKAMFDNSFASIYQKTEMREFKNLIKFLKINNLKNQDSVNYDNIIKGDGCYYFYSISVDHHDEVTLTYGTNSNDEYRKSHPDEEEICSEYAVAWTFKFDGKALHFLKHRIAG